jgi:restriction system protein
MRGVTEIACSPKVRNEAVSNISVEIKSKEVSRIVAGALEARYSASGDRILRYQVDLRHLDLNVHKLISAPNLRMLQAKLDALTSSWDEKLEAKRRRDAAQAGVQAAEDEAIEAATRLDSLNGILEQTLKINDAVDWSSLKDTGRFPQPEPTFDKSEPPEKHRPKVGWWKTLIGQKKKILEAAWVENKKRHEEWKKREILRYEEFQTIYQGWIEEREFFYKQQAK